MSNIVLNTRGDCVVQVMILELCQHAQEYMHKHNVPPKSSFYEEMMENKRKCEEQKAKEKQKQLEHHIKVQQRQVTKPCEGIVY